MIRLAVVGAGAWGLNHVRVIASDPRCELAGVVDPDPVARANVEALVPGTPTFSDADRVLADPRVDGVVIASPAPTHASLATAALEAGRHVLVEKPLAMRAADASALVAAAARRDRIAMVGHLMVYHPAVVRLRDLLQSGALGTLHYIHSTRVNLGKLRREESALWSFGPHDLSMFDFLLGQSPQTVSARGHCVLQRGVEDIVFLTLRYPDNAMAHIHLSWLSPRKERRLTVVCSQKMAEFDDVAADKLRIYDKGYDRPPNFTEYATYLTLRDGDVHIPTIPMQEPLRVQLRHFVECIEKRQQPITDLASGLRVIRVLEAAQASLADDGVPVAVR